MVNNRFVFTLRPIPITWKKPAWRSLERMHSTLALTSYCRIFSLRIRKKIYDRAYKTKQNRNVIIVQRSRSNDILITFFFLFTVKYYTSFFSAFFFSFFLLLLLIIVPSIHIFDLPSIILNNAYNDDDKFRLNNSLILRNIWI